MFIVKGMFQAGLDLIIPKRCNICGLYLDCDNLICKTCADSIPFIDSHICPGCGFIYPKSLKETHLCGKCLDDPPSYQSLTVLTHYDDPIKTVLQRLKYAGDTTGLHAIKYCYQKKKNTLPTHVDVIIPVPLNVKRLRQRGYNQALLIACELFPEKKKMIQPNILQRCRNTISQTSLSRKQRQENLMDAFEIRNPEDVRGKRVCLVDDVFTTGATAEECSKKLINTGCYSVDVVSVSRTNVR